MWFKASAPGNLMLLGEYAVLDGGFALVAAVNQRMSVRLLPSKDTKIRISSQLGSVEVELSQFDVRAPFQFVLTTIKKYQKWLTSGFDLCIESEFSEQIGFGSSAAVTVATLSVLQTWLNKSVHQTDLIREAREIVREVQGIGSGADVAACVLGGVVAYRAEPFSAERLSYTHPITVMYSGSKTKTTEAIQHVKKYFAAQPELFQEISQSIDLCAQSGIQAARENNPIELGKIMNIQQGLMQSLNVSNQSLDEIINVLKNDTNILGAKISGSGLGDCVVGLGSANCKNDLRNIAVEITPLGVYCEKN